MTLRWAPLRLILVLLLGGLLQVLAPMSGAAAGSCTVTSTDDSGAGSLRACLDSVATGDVITITATGTITLASSLVISKSVTVAGPGAAKLAISGNNAVRVFTLSLVTATISGVTIRDGNAPGTGGGGIYVDGTLNLADAVVANNRGPKGGGIYANFSAVTLTNTTVSENTATDSIGGGGGIDNDGGTLTVLHSTIANNTVAGSLGGGGIYNYGTLTMTDSVVSGNSASNSEGGGIRNVGSATIAGSAISGNTAVSAGGGGGVANRGNLTLTNSTVSGNTAKYKQSDSYKTSLGGGISNSRNATISGTTISGNNASSSGGGIYSAETTGSHVNLTVTNSTISGNTAAFGGGLATFGQAMMRFSTVIGNNATNTGGVASGESIYVGATYDLQISASIVIGNQASETPDCSMYGAATITSQGYNVVGSGTGCPSAGTSDTTATNAGGILDTTLANNGGPTLTHALITGSPAIDRVPTANCADAAGKDQRGVDRPVGSACDSGAYEGSIAAPSPSPSPSANPSPSASPSPSPVTSPSPSPSPSPSASPCGQMFGDVAASNPACQAIEGLAARGVIRGCDPTASPPLFCPDEGTKRHQMAALIVRAIPAWVSETGLPTFGDNTADTELMTRVATLQRHGVVRGYQADVCAERGIATPPGCYGPLDTVKYGQVMLFIARAMEKAGYWTLQADDRTIFPDQNGAVGADPDTDQQTLDHRYVVTYVHYVGNPPDVTDVHANFGLANGQGWADASSRAWFARAFWPAIQDH